MDSGKTLEIRLEEKIVRIIYKIEKDAIMRSAYKYVCDYMTSKPNKLQVIAQIKSDIIEGKFKDVFASLSFINNNLTTLEND